MFYNLFVQSENFLLNAVDKMMLEIFPFISILQAVNLIDG